MYANPLISLGLSFSICKQGVSWRGSSGLLNSPAVTLTLGAGRCEFLQVSATFVLYRDPERVCRCIPRAEPTAAGPADPQDMVSTSFYSACQGALMLVGSCALGHVPVKDRTHWVGCCD